MNSLDLAYAVGAALLSPVWARKARGGWAQRFGKQLQVVPKVRGKPRLLIHAVSVGEVNTLRSLVPMLREQVEVVVTASTDTGLARAIELFGGGEDAGRVLRYPLDFSPAVERFLDAVQPDAVALVELEVWPNFVASCARRKIPVAVINGRLSARSFKGYHRIRRLISPTFARLDFAAVQDEAYAQRFVAMGVPPGRVRVSGTMKWDAVALTREVAGANELAEALGIDRSRPLVVAGSTAEGEEALVHQACSAIGAHVQVLCAPRKPERFDQAASDLPGCVRRSARRSGGGLRGQPSPTGRYLLDSLGELRAAYSLADVCVVGRTFVPQRGSDPIEPCAVGKPVVMGPDVGNFEASVAALRAAGAVQIVSREALGSALAALISDHAKRELMVRAGWACVRDHQGATARHAGMLLELVRARLAQDV